jgi:D-serine deaminase-like pyridoxal phosphate-dependent protein
MSSTASPANAWGVVERPGCSASLVTDLDVFTPAAVVDLDRLEHNLSRWQAHCDRLGLASRPHVKTHKCVEIARRQMQLGAVGVTCQTLHEAEVMAGAGIRDIVLPYNLVGGEKLARLASLLSQATVRVSVDDAALLAGLVSAAVGTGRELGVMVDCDTGLGRTGVDSPDAAADLAQLVAGTEGLRFAGLLTYPAPPGARGFLDRAVELLEHRGIRTPVVSAGGTPTMWRSGELIPVVNEYRVGTYAFHDRATVAAGAAALDDVALTVAATVVSRRNGRAILDAGSKALSSDRGPDESFGHVFEAPSSSLRRLDEEHGYVSLSPGESLELGQQVRVVPNHACVVANLFEELVIVGKERPVTRWPVARGR